MTSWPWMKGIAVAVADPIDPVCPEDDRPSVKALIQEHANKIAKIKAALVDDPLYDANKHDDLWILRFWLSHKKSKHAIEAAKYTLKFRQQHNLDDKDIRTVAPPYKKDGLVGEFFACWPDGTIRYLFPDPQRGVICLLHIASIDHHATVEKCSEEHFNALFIYSSEWAHQCLDYVTRTTGRLTKTIRVADCGGITLSSFNREANRRNGNAMALMEDCYPQLMEAFYVHNAPSFVGVIWKVVTSFAPKRVVSKFDIISPKDNEKDHKKLLRHISNDNLPRFLQWGKSGSTTWATADGTVGIKHEIAQ